MYSKAKYVVGEVQSQYGSVLAAVCFPESVTHSDLRDVFVQDSIRSAGFFHVNDDLTVQTYGDSVSLGVKSQEGDEKFVSRALALPATIT